MKITTPAIIALAQTLEGETIATVRDRRSFQVVVRPKGGGLEFVPARTKRPRRAPPEQIDAVLAIYGKTGSLRKADYQDVSFNASYILALIKHFTDQELQTAEISADKVETQFLHKVAEASTLSQAKLAELLAGAPVMPEKIAVLATVEGRDLFRQQFNRQQRTAQPVSWALAALRARCRGCIRDLR